MNLHVVLALTFSLLLVSFSLSDVYASIFTDKNSYTWTDKIVITARTHGWEADEDRAKITSSAGQLDSYKLSKAGKGLYTAEIILTGFLHDADGDGKHDTNPRTTGTGPNNGFLEVQRDDTVKILLKFDDGGSISETIKISWNEAKIGFDAPNYSGNDSAKLQVIDPDMNLNPRTLDKVPIHVYSSSDSAGITINAIETTEESGIFEGEVLFGSNTSSGNRLYAVSNDVISAKYTDRTLPHPFSINDEMEMTVEAWFDSEPKTPQSTEGAVSWSSPKYSAYDKGTVQVIDPDMNLNPDIVDTFTVHVRSSSDVDGTDLTMTETDPSSGIFLGKVTFVLADESSGHRLRVIHDDSIWVDYTDGSSTIHSTIDDVVLRDNSKIYKLPAAPQKQQNAGIADKDISCKHGLQKIFRHDGFVACVTPLSAEKLIYRDWGRLANSSE